MDMLEVLYGIQIVYQITCLSPYLINRKTWTLKESKLLEIYNVTIIIVSLLVLLFSLVANDDFIQTNNNDLEQTLDFIDMLGIRVAHLVSISEALFKKKEQNKMYEEIKQIDRIFLCSLNIDVKNKKFHRTTLLFGFLMAFIYLTAELVTLNASSASHEENFLLFWFFYLMPLLISGLRYFQMFTAVRILKHRLDLLVNILSQINQKVQQKEAKNLHLKQDMLALFGASIFKCSRSCNMEKPELNKLLTVRDLYNRLFRLNEILNCYFGLSMLINVGNDFISITSNFYWIFCNFHDFYMTKKFVLLIGSSIVWSLPHLLNVVVLAMICESTVQKTNKIALNLHRINIDIWNDDHNTVVQHFSLQLLHQKISITAAGFFSIDCTLLYTIVGATTTYLIILIQLHMSETKSSDDYKH